MTQAVVWDIKLELIQLTVTQHCRLVCTMATSSQIVIFLSLYISYLLNVYVRRSVGYAIPDIAGKENLDKGQLGLMFSSQMFAYAVSKFLCGILVDTISPRLSLCVGLLLCGVTVLLFSCAPTSVTVFTILWFLNGLAQGPGWPAAALIMKAWYRKDQFGRAWSVLSTSMNVAGTAGPLITAYIITQSGWRASLLVPGVLSIVTAFVVFVIVQDTPTGNKISGTQESKDTKETSEISRLKLFRLPGYTGICLTYGALSIIQYGCLQWGPLYLVQDMKQSIIAGNSYLSSLEVGGIIGSLLAGWVSDSLLSKHPDQQIHVIRQYVIAWFSAVLCLFLLFMVYFIQQESPVIWITCISFGLGLSIYGPIAIFGVVAMETAPHSLAGTAHAVACLFANGGQTLAGLPFSYMAKLYGWKSVFLLQSLLAGVVATYLFIYSLYLHKHRQLDEKKAA